MSTAVVDNKGLEAPSPFKTFMKNNMQLLLVTLALLVVLAFFSFAVPNFAFVNRDVYLGIVLQSAYIGVMALGATFVIATSGIDLSVGTGLSLVAVMAGIFLAGDKMNLPLGAGLVLTLLVGMAIGLVNGLNVSILGLPPFIATLAMMMVARGLALIISDKASISIANPGYKFIASGMPIPYVANAGYLPHEQDAAGPLRPRDRLQRGSHAPVRRQRPPVEDHHLRGRRRVHGCRRHPVLGPWWPRPAR